MVSLQSLKRKFTSRPADQPSRLQLEDGSKIAVIGGGPAGSFASYFILDFAEMMGLELELDIYEPRDFLGTGPASCNHCGGIISETLVQLLAADGIKLPPNVVQRGIDAYVLHMDAGDVRIDTPLQEKRIAAVYRGGGPRGIQEIKWAGFDGYLQGLAAEKGAHVIKERVDQIGWVKDRPEVSTRKGLPRVYDLVVGAVGVNTNALKMFSGLDFGYAAPATTRTYICEFLLGEDLVQKHLGNSMHVFLLNIPRLEFAALIPKGDYVTVCLLGEDIDKEMIQEFLDSDTVRACLPPDWEVPDKHCHCGPLINIQPAAHPYVDRMVLIGDCGVTRLYKDGIGAAYRTAKAVASTAIFEGIAAEDFERHYGPTYQSITADNRIGKAIFAITRQIQNRRIGREIIHRMVAHEQVKGGEQRMSTVLWDMFTGSAPYREIFMRTLHPAFGLQFVRHLGAQCIQRVIPQKASTIDNQLETA